MTSSPHRSLIGPKAPLLAALLAASLAGCATQSSNIERLPFHVAIAPAVVTVDAQLASQQREGNPTGLMIEIDAEQVGRQLTASLEQAFMRVSSLPADANASLTTKDWAARAQAVGADLLLRPQLTYAPTVNSSLNDRFWLNLPLFAIGGPFGWFVADRSYYCDSELSGILIDVSLAAASSVRAETVDDDAKVIEVLPPRSTETSLNFLDRADGAMPYLLSLVIPAGLIASESSGAKGALDAGVIEQVSRTFAADVLNRSSNITRWRGVTFYPRDLRVDVVGGQRVLQGQLWLVPGAATAISRVRHRLDGQDWQDTDWREVDTAAPTASSKGRTTYEFQIPLASDFSGAVQLDVAQNDRFQTHRTFTHRL